MIPITATFAPHPFYASRKIEPRVVLFVAPAFTQFVLVYPGAMWALDLANIECWRA